MSELRVDEEIVLRPMELSDVRLLFRTVDRQRVYLRQWLPWVDGTRTEADTERFVSAAVEQAAQDGGGGFLIWCKGEFCGVIGHHRIDRQNRCTSLGYWLSEARQGQGIMIRACRRLVQRAFLELNLNRVEIRCALANHRSRAVPQRLGFRQEKVLCQAEWLNGRFVDLVVYGAVADEWRNAGKSSRH